MVDVGVRSNFVAAWHAARIMAPQGSGLIVAISGYTGVTYTYGVVFGTAKSAADRMARDMAVELKPFGVTSLSLWQGLTFTERAERNLAAIPGLNGQAATRPENGCSPEYPGLVIAALSDDPGAMRHSGGTFITAELGDAYGIKDIDGSVDSLAPQHPRIADLGTRLTPAPTLTHPHPLEVHMSTTTTSDRQAKLDILLDRQEILDTLVRFSRGMDRFDRGLFLSAFHPDAVIAAGDFVGGPVDLYEWATPMHQQGQVATHHNLLNHTCDIDGDTAHTETYYLFAARNRDASNWLAGGRYLDRLERRDGLWRIALRTNAIEWSGLVPSMDIPFADVHDIHLNGVPSRDGDDPSYQRPLINARTARVPT